MSTGDVRETVKEAYTEALKRSQKSAGASGCCGPSAQASSCCGVSSLAGYGEEQAKFATAAVSSFGCGNPLAFAEVGEGQTVVDLGSGAGLDLLIASERVGARGRVIGIDMTDAMIEAARKNAARAGATNVEIRKGYIEELPIESASADWVISNCVINLSPDKERVFREIARVLAAGGRFRISDIVVGDDLPERLRSSAAAYTACVAGAISEEEYVRGLEAAGLVDVKVIERMVYDADQLRGFVASDLENLGFDPKALDAEIEGAAGKVWSALVVGRKP